MFHISRRSLLAAGAATLVMPSAGAFAQQDKKVLRFGLSSYPPSLAPWNNTGTAAITVKVQIFRGLLGYGDDGKLRGELAESWKSDGKSWVFKLRDAVFHNGKPVTSEDVKWSYEQIAAETSTAYFRTEFRNIERIDTPDPKTVIAVMKEPMVTFPFLTASPHTPIVAKGSTDNGAPGIGAGPYTIKAQERGVSIELAAFDKFYRPGFPKIPTIKMVAYTDENLRVTAVQVGDVDLIEYVPWQHMAAIEKNNKLRLDTAFGPFMGLNFNGEAGPFKDARLRRAVGHAIRREEIVEAAFFGRGSPMEGLPVPKESAFFDEKRSKYYAYNPDMAKKLMAEAGFAKGFSCTLLSTAQYGMHKSTAEVVQQHLGEIGIDVKLNLPDWATRVALGNKGQYEFCVQGTAPENNDFDGLAPLVNSSLPPNISRSFGLPVPKVDELFAKGRAEFDPEKRKAIYAELEQQALEQATLVGLAWRAQGYAMNANLKNFKSLNGGINFFTGYIFEQVEWA